MTNEQGETDNVEVVVIDVERECRPLSDVRFAVAIPHKTGSYAHSVN